MPVIHVDHVVKIYKNSARGVTGTLNVDLTIRQGEFVFIVGNHGAGKSTLMELIAGELEPDRGSVRLGSADLARLRRGERAAVLACMGTVLEDSELRRTETVFKNLASLGRLEYLKDKLFHQLEIDKALSLVGMADSGERYASELTPSECRRVELARAIWRSPQILLLDALTDRADDDTVWDMLHLLSALNARGTTVVMTAGNGSYGSILHKRIVTLDDGKVTGDRRG